MVYLKICPVCQRPDSETLMLLDLSQMREARERIDRTYQPAMFEPEEDIYRIVEPVHLVFEILKRGHEFRLVGRVASTLELACSRCLELFRLPVDEAFDLMYLPQSENVGEGEIEVDEASLTAAFYRDDLIDLGGLMREQFYLALPLKPLCKPSCSGLCPVCGVNRNTGSCTCTASWTDSRWEGLRLFRKGTEGR